MIKKALKITIFFVFVLLLFSSCVRKVEKCKFFPGIEINEQKNSESDEKIQDFLKKGKPKAEISCKF